MHIVQIVKKRLKFNYRLSAVNKRGLRYWLMSLFIMLTATQLNPAKAAGKIIKWKDDQNVTHYGDTVPAQYSSRESSVISKQGITLQHNKPVNNQDTGLIIAKQEQDKKDKALLNAFTTEKEIDLARDRNLQMDQISVDGLQMQKSNSLNRLTANQKYALDLIRRKKPLPADLYVDIKSNQAEIVKYEQQIVERKAVMEATKKRFDDDKARYMKLKNFTQVNTSLTDNPSLIKR